MAPSHEERIKSLKAKREAFRIELHEFKDILDDPDILSHGRSIPYREIGLRLEDIQTEYASFAKNQQELDTIDDTGELLHDRMKLKSFYTQVRAQALDLLPGNNLANTNTPAQNSDGQPNQSSPYYQTESTDIDVQLPKINLPTFSGNYEDWPGFADQFRSAVHDNVRISDCKKLTYLRSCLKGEALKGIESLTNSAANYGIAWTLLEKQYNQPAVIVSKHLKALFDLPSVTRPAHRELRSFLCNVEAHYRSLQPLKQPTPDTLLIHLLLTKLDKDTALKWREYTRNDSFPTLNTFFEFLHERCQVLEPLANHYLPHPNPTTSAYTPRGQIAPRHQTLQRGTPRPSFRDHRQMAPQVYTTQVVTSCSFCKGAHFAQQCETFNRLSIPDRHKLVQSKGLCSNCLRPNHNASDCRSTTCKRCHKKHHTLLHTDDVTNSPTDMQSHITCLNSHLSSEILLATAVIEILDTSGQTHLCRVLLDSCSHANFLNYKFCNKLGLTLQRATIPLSGANNMSSTITRQTNATFKSQYNGYSQTLTFLIVDRVSQRVPSSPIDHKTLQIPQNLPLADPRFYESAEIDGLLGAQVFWDLLSVGCIKLAKDGTKLHKTKLGWVFVGELVNPCNRTGIICNVVTNSLEQQISRFWELEERSVKRHLSPEERACESHYLQHTRRDAGSGRYSVKLPFKENITQLGESYPMAFKRFLALERQLDRNPQMKEQYSAFLKEYQQLGHMTISSSKSLDGYFVPHHAVTKVDSLTTKIRVVFDASAKTSSGISLNDALMVGPTVQDDLFTLISRFRTHPYVTTADITKMYRQIDLSRGINPADFLKSKIWTNGPTWLRNDATHWPTTILSSVQVPEQRPATVLNVTIKPKPHYEILRRFSTFTTLIRVLAYCYRFRNNSLEKTKNTGQLNIEELQHAQHTVIKLTQMEEFQSEFNHLKDRTGSEYKGRLIALKPFIDSTGLIRVGGRLTNSNLKYDHKHQIVLPDNHPVTDLLIRQHHLSHGHAGAQATLNAVRQKYWPINGRVRTKAIIHKCLTCCRARPIIPDYQMGTLPKNRVTFTRPFLTTGVDYCGPFHIKEKKLRNTRKIKCYVAVFVCLATKAIHLEVVSDLTTDAFIAALRRFFARRGKSTDIYSDNATNFVGANREIREIYKLTRSETHNEIITRHLANENINWHFIPPRAPHFGGLWEAAVKSLKHHTTRILKNTLFTYEAFTTCLAEIEAILNSRPITSLSSDPTDLIALTPGHFLIGDSITSIPERDFTATNTGRLSSWQQIQQVRQHFWSRWHHEYLNELTVRQKWHRHRDADIREGMLVILKEDHLPPLCWPLGRIITIHPGEDGTVRVVTVKTAHGTYKRATKRIAPLPINVE